MAANALRIFRVLLLLAICCSSLLIAKPQPVQCAWTGQPIRIDGKADEPAWARAHVQENFHLAWLLEDARPAKTKTRARLLWDRTHLYFFAEMEDTDIFADVTEHDGDTWNNDVFEIFLKPPGDKGYYEFHVNAANTHLDLFMPHRGNWLVHRLRRGQKFHMQTKVVLRGTLNQWRDNDKGWSVEGRIPWKDLAGTGGAPKAGEQWSIALCRYDYSVGWENPELSSIAPYQKLNFHRHEDFLPVIFEGPKTAGLKRIPWRDSKVVGSPDPPLPYITERAWPNLPVKMPLALKQIPGTKDHLAYLNHSGSWGGTGSLWVFQDRRGINNQVAALKVADELLYGFCFHPRFKENGYIYTGGNGPVSKKTPTHSRVTRWTMDRKTHKVDPKSRLVLLEWKSDGHNGCDVVFGNDGMLYITSGDGTSDSDVNITGQRIDLLLSKVLRINVDKPAKGKAYSVPQDNPFLKTPNARPETWAHGFRNPWRITCDEKTGHIWVGENGQDLWESVKLVEKGANYGWSVYEGSHPFYLERKLGPGKLTKPTLEHHHREARSLTGGVVYYGSDFPKLRGAYVYGDFSTGKIWAAKHDGEKLLWHKEIADTPFAITGFGVDTKGRLIVIDDASGFHRLIPNPRAGQRSNFPKQLSHTGLFSNTAKHQPHPALIPYSVAVPHWNGGATEENYIAMPGDEKVSMTFSANRGWSLPEGSVLVQTLSLGGRRVETRLLTRQQKEWAGYSYEWNAQQTDATLVGRDGKDLQLRVKGQVHPWRIPSRAECMVCHSRAVKYVLGLTDIQMNRTHDYGTFKGNQLDVLKSISALKQIKRPKDGPILKLVNPRNPKANLTARVRSYWQANCSHCHVEAGGGNAQMELEYRTKLEDTRTLNAKPVHKDFGLGTQARIIVPGMPGHSVMLQRIISPGAGRMPPIGHPALDPQWIQLLTQWISGLEKRSSSP